MIGVILAFVLNVGFADQVLVPGGTFSPLFADKGEKAVKIESLMVDKTPVTNEQYLKFIQAFPKWNKSEVNSLMADGTYLDQWTAPFAFPSRIAKFPVVHVSWFAARAYCKSVGARLPTILEWEYFSDSANPEQETKTLEWYSKGQASLRAVGESKANKYGLYDTAGLIWEWVEDFSSAIMSSDSREGVKRDMFCAGASLNAKNPKQYAAFMRYALRSSLKAQYTTSSLGFRCVKEKK